MAYCIMRFSKMKSNADLSLYGRHNDDRARLERYGRLAHPERSDRNKHIHHSMYSDSETMVQRFEKRTEGIKYRKDAVRALEFVFAASPGALEEKGFPFRDWCNANLQFLSDNFGGSKNIISFDVHYDETSLHCHALVVPLIDGKLNCKALTGGRKKMFELQDRYAEKMAQFGLERGRDGRNIPKDERAQHSTLKEWYEHLGRDHELYDMLSSKTVYER